MAAGDVLGVVFAILQAGEEGRRQDAGRVLDQSQFGLHQVGRIVRHLDVGVQQLAGDADKGHGATGGILPAGALQSLVLAVGLGQQGLVQVAQQGDKVLNLGCAQHLVEQQVVDVQQRVAGDKDGHVGVAGLLVDGEKLLFDAGADDETIPRQPLPLGLRQGQGEPHVAQVGCDGLMVDSGHGLDGRLLKWSKDQFGADQSGRGGWSGGGLGRR